MQFEESGIPPTIEIQSSSSSDKECGIQYTESGIYDVKSRIQDAFPGFPYLRRLEVPNTTTCSKSIFKKKLNGYIFNCAF